jgi:hypothetical protein
VTPQSPLWVFFPNHQDGGIAKTHRWNGVPNVPTESAG